MSAKVGCLQSSIPFTLFWLQIQCVTCEPPALPTFAMVRRSVQRLLTSFLERHGFDDVHSPRRLNDSCRIQMIPVYPIEVAGWWFGTWLLFFHLSIYIYIYIGNNHHPSWLIHIFQEGRLNQQLASDGVGQHRHGENSQGGRSGPKWCTMEMDLLQWNPSGTEGCWEA